MKSKIALLLFLFAANADAAGFTTVDRGVVALGSGGTGTANAEDPAANVYNPAAATTDEGFVVSAGAVLGFPSVTAKSEAWSVGSDADLVTPPMLHARFSNGDFAAGASLTVPFGSSVNWPVGWPGRFELQKAKLTDLRISAFAGASFDRFAVAAGPFMDVASLLIERSLDFVEEEGQTQIDMRARGFGATIAAYFRPSDQLALGLNYTSRSKLSFSGYADFSVPPEFSGRAQDTKITSIVRLPDRITLGALYAVNEELKLSADLELVLWSTVDRLALDFESAETADVIQPRNWHTTVVPRIGGAYQVLDWFQVRGGMFLDPSPVPKDTVGPSSPDSLRFGLAFGAGAELASGFAIDAGYQLIFLTGAKSEAESATLSGVSYSGLVNLIGLSATYRR